MFTIPNFKLAFRMGQDALEEAAHEVEAGVHEVADRINDALLARKMRSIGEDLQTFKANVEALAEAGKSEEPFKTDLKTFTNALRAQKDSSAGLIERYRALETLEKAVQNKISDSKVAGLNLDDPASGGILAEELKKRYQIKFRLEEGVKNRRGKYNHKKLDPEGEAKTLYELYQSLGKAPAFPHSHLKKITTTLMPADKQGEGAWYSPSGKSAGIECKRPDESLNYTDHLFSDDNFPTKTDEEGREVPDRDPDCMPKNRDEVNYFSWATLHEVGHAVDAKHGWMDKNQKSNKYGGWIEYGSNVKPIAEVVAAHFGGEAGLEGDDLKTLTKYTVDMMKSGRSRQRGSDEEKAVRPDVDAWVAAVRVDKGLWWDQAQSKANAIGGRVYHEAYGNSWVSYKLDARRQGIQGYQFRAPGEWFAELYAACYSDKMKDSHPFMKELKALEK